MRFVVWDKDKLKNLSTEEKEQWFDVYNNGLERDRGISLEDPNIVTKQKEIKEDYFTFLHDYTRSEDFRAYFLLIEDDKIVSLCRVLPNVTLYLEGVETHREYQGKGYGTILLQKTLEYLKELDYTELRSRVSIHNEASLQLHKKVGFIEYDHTDELVRFKYTIMNHPRYLLNQFSGHGFLIWLWYGIPYHKDNNNRYYKDILKDQWANVVFTLILVHFFIIFTQTRTDITMNSDVVLLSSAVLFLLCTNLFNIIRLCRTKDQKYHELVRKFTMQSSFLIIGAHIASYFILFISNGLGK